MFVRTEEVTKLVFVPEFCGLIDHEALKYVIIVRDPHGRIARWISLLTKFDYRQGPKNATASYLSRLVDPAVIATSNYKLEENLIQVRKYLHSGKVEANDAQVRKAVKARAKHNLVYEGILFRRTLAGIRHILDLYFRTSILFELHFEIGHWYFKTT